MTVSSFYPNTWVVFCLTWKLLWIKLFTTWGLNSDSLCCCRRIMNADRHESSLTSFLFNASFSSFPSLIRQKMICHVTEKSEHTTFSVLKNLAKTKQQAKQEERKRKSFSFLVTKLLHKAVSVVTVVLFISCILAPIQNVFIKSVT